MIRLTEEQFEQSLKKQSEDLESVDTVIRSVKKDGDSAVRWFTQLFDKVDVDTFELSSEEVDKALESVSPALMDAIRTTVDNVKQFAEIQKKQLNNFEIELNPGIFTGQQVTAIDSVCVYVPGGRYPLISSAVMGAVPASVAGVSEICLASPPSSNGTIAPEIIAAGVFSGVNRFFRVGGAQAIASFAYGTESIPRVSKIVGPGNKFVAEAKRKVYGTVGIDFIAGPTELAVVADTTADPVLIASDLLAQAEHDRDASVYLFADSESTADSVEKAVNAQLREQPGEVAEYSLNANGGIIVYTSFEQAAQWVNRLAPEHLSLQGKSVEASISLFRNFGSMFIGEASCEALADYAAGINHTLPTGGAARYTAGLNVMDFLKCQTTLRVVDNFNRGVFDASETIAQAEGLMFHAQSLKKRTSLSKV